MLLVLLQYQPSTTGTEFAAGTNPEQPPDMTFLSAGHVAVTADHPGVVIVVQSRFIAEKVPPPPVPAQSFSSLLTAKVPSELVAKVAFVPLSIYHPIHPGLRLNPKKALPACTPTLYLIVGTPPNTEVGAVIL